MRGCYAGYLLQGKSDGALGRSRTDNLLIRSQMLYPLSYERLTVTQSTCRRDNGYADFLLPRTPAVVALVHTVGSGCIESRVEQLIGRGNADFGKPQFVPAIVNLKQAIATFGTAYCSWTVLAFSVCDEECALLKVIGPRIPNDLNNFCLCVLRDVRGGCNWC